MGDMRKDYVLEREVIVHPTTKKNTNTKKCPYCPGNESMTNPSLLSLVERDGMLQRLQDSEDFFVDDWSVRVFESKEPTVSIPTKNSYSDRPLYSEPAYGYHYIVVVSPKHKDTIATISTEQLSNVLVVVQDRLRWLYTQKESHTSLFSLIMVKNLEVMWNIHTSTWLVFQLYLQELTKKLNLRIKSLTKRVYAQCAR